MVQELPKRKPAPRLQCLDYKGQYAYSITICIHNKSPIFKDEKVVNDILETLHSVCSQAKFSILAYCFMPDHLHLLLGGGEDTDFVKMMKSFKQITSYRFKNSYGKLLWQRGYYDHILRKDEDIEVVARYIWGNSVRKGLVESIDDYPFSGPREI
ncbi:transposase [candidate division TA06 bacterium B3_TA06]|uniref:Transposase n=1 Tax=candidate division TA06 bacterium B3_TA06 TaxID=2012487 RepID=A0A532V103_UNCT6|nr:MAG: transposase [candidate division TA06 bacterium B3_TA06]